MNEKKPRKQLTREEEIEQYRKYQEWARQQTWVTIETPDGGLMRLTLKEARERQKRLHPVLHRGKTLDELFEPWPKMQEKIEAMRKEGKTDREIWESFPPSWPSLLDERWDRIEANNK